MMRLIEALILPWGLQRDGNKNVMRLRKWAAAKRSRAETLCCQTATRPDYPPRCGCTALASVRVARRPMVIGEDAARGAMGAWLLYTSRLSEPAAFCPICD